MNWDFASFSLGMVAASIWAVFIAPYVRKGIDAALRRWKRAAEPQPVEENHAKQN